MLRSNLKLIVSGAVLIAVATAAPRAEAGFHHHHRGWGGGYGSSGGSWGSSGGSWGSSGGSWGSSGGSSGGYYGSWGGSSGGYVTSYGSSGGSSGGWSNGSSGGSSGGGYIVPGAPSTPPSTPMPPTPPATPPGPSDAAPGPGSSTYHPVYGPARSAAMLNVTVPADAKVFVNGIATTSTGTNRQYVSRRLQDGARYNYEVRAEFVRDGQIATETKTVQLMGGQSADLAFIATDEATEQAAAEPVRTTLTLNVPADAKVYLSGREMKAMGPVRQFSTTKLTAGDSWNDYVIQATIERDGQLVTKEQTVSLKAGDVSEITLSFDEPQLADNAR